MDKRPTSLRIGLSRSSVALLGTRGWLRRHSNVLAERPLDTASPQQTLHGLRAALADAGCARLATTVVLADDWTRLFMVTPPHNTERLRDCQAAAAQRFQSLYGEPVDGWTINADWDAQHPFMACALPRPILGVLQQVGAERHLTLVGIVPQFIAAWNRWQGGVHDSGWYGSVHAGVLTLGVIERHRLRDLRRLPVPSMAQIDPAWLPEQLTREALRLALPVPQRIYLCGSVPTVWFAPGTSALTCIRLDAMAQGPERAGDSPGVALAYTGART